MAKGHFNLSLDVDIWEQVKNKYPNQISFLVNQFLTGLAKYSSDTEDINLSLEKIKLDEELKKLSNLTLDIEKRKMNISKEEERKQKETELELEKQKEEIRKSKLCSNCGKTIKNKPTLLNGLKYCKLCFMEL